MILMLLSFKLLFEVLEYFSIFHEQIFLKEILSLKLNLIFEKFGEKIVQLNKQIMWIN
jgi:hypothetical protein